MNIPDITAIKNAFSGAMAYRWSPDALKVTIPDLPGMEGYLFEQGEFKVFDGDFVSLHTDFKVGMIVIWYQNVPVWIMHRWYRYADAALPFVEKCLRSANIEEGQTFHGSRGRPEVPNGRYTYRNHGTTDFTCFWGSDEVEEVVGQHKKIVGTCRYDGRLMIGRLEA